MLTEPTAWDTETASRAVGSWAKNRPKGELTTAAITMITTRATSRTQPPTTADTAPVTAAAAFATTWMARLNNLAAPFTVCLVWANIRRCICRLAAFAARAAEPADRAAGFAADLTAPLRSLGDKGAFAGLDALPPE